MIHRSYSMPVMNVFIHLEIYLRQKFFIFRAFFFMIIGLRPSSLSYPVILHYILRKDLYKEERFGQWKEGFGPLASLF